MCPNHVCNARTQASGFEAAKASLKEHKALVVVDFAKNFTCRELVEVKNTYWNRNNTTNHPVVAMFNKNKAVFRNELTTIKLPYIVVLQAFLIQRNVYCRQHQRSITRHQFKISTFWFNNSIPLVWITPYSPVGWFLNLDPILLLAAITRQQVWITHFWHQIWIQQVQITLFRYNSCILQPNHFLLSASRILQNLAASQLR